jgi:nickel/cobalt transporter (NicO) family protein
MRSIRAHLALLLTGLALLAGMAIPRPTSAHPLGNSTINHFDRLTVSADAVRVLHVVDMAEIPTVSERLDMDIDNDDVIDDAETRAYLADVVPALVSQLELDVDGRRIALRPEASARLTFPAGQAGLDTLRIELDLLGELPADAIGDGIVDVTFRDRADADRIGWREVVVVAGAGATITEASAGAVSISDDLWAYPADALDNPIDVRKASFHAMLHPGAPAPTVEPSGTASPPSAGDDPLAGLLNGANGGPIAVLLALLVSLGLGAAHAASPGHGKTLMAAYLIGSRGTSSQALALALTVAVTHTIGVLVLGIVVLAASDVLLPERVVDWLGLAAGVIVLAMGIRLTVRLLRVRSDPGHGHPHGHEHAHGPGHGRHGGDHGHGHSHHGRSGTEGLSRRSVALIGLAGGMVPSTSALIVLLVGVSQAQVVLGIALVVAFGVGMAVVLAGIGLAVVLGRRWIDGGHFRPARHPLVARVAGAVPAVSAVTVLLIGVVLAVGAVSRIA